MSRILADLLGAREPVFTHTIQDLEKETGRQNIDIRLSTEIGATVRQKIRELGLDPKDSHGAELYAVLQDIVAIHDRFLSASIGVKDTYSPTEALIYIKQCVDRLPIPKRAWAMKLSVARKMIRQAPPKRVMKLMNHRSIDSMLKRESPVEILAAARIVESSTWMKQFLRSYRDLKSTDFESRDIEVIVLDSERYGEASKDFIAQKHRNILLLKELGAVILLPLPARRLRGTVITLLPITLYYINELRFYSSYLKFNQVRPDFSALLIDMLIGDLDNAISLHGQNLHWRVVQKHFGKSSKKSSEVFGPYIQHEDFEWKTAEDVLFRLEPALMFWQGLDFVGARFGRQTLSFNLMDNAISYCNGLTYASQISVHLKKNLWAELWSRYMDQQNIEDKVVAQLEKPVAEKFSFNFEEIMTI